LAQIQEQVSVRFPARISVSFHEVLGSARVKLLRECRGLKLVRGVLHEDQVLSVDPAGSHPFGEEVLDDMKDRHVAVVGTLREQLSESFIFLHLFHLVIQDQELWDLRVRLELPEVRETLTKTYVETAPPELVVGGLPFAVRPVDKSRSGGYHFVCIQD